MEVLLKLVVSANSDPVALEQVFIWAKRVEAGTGSILAEQAELLKVNTAPAPAITPSAKSPRGVRPAPEAAAPAPEPSVEIAGEDSPIEAPAESRCEIPIKPAIAESIAVTVADAPAEIKPKAEPAPAIKPVAQVAEVDEADEAEAPPPKKRGPGRPRREPPPAPVPFEKEVQAVMPPGYTPPGMVEGAAPAVPVTTAAAIPPGAAIPAFPNAIPAAMPRVPDGPRAQDITGVPSLEDLRAVLNELEKTIRVGTAFSVLRHYGHVMVDRVPPEQRQTIINDALARLSYSSANTAA